MNTGIQSPRGIWWKPADRTGKLWLSIAFGWGLVLFPMRPRGHLKGAQSPPGIRHRVDPSAYARRVNEFIKQYKVGEEAGHAIVEPPPGSDVYVMGRMWAWEPILKLRKGVEYTLHLSSLDLNHGFSLQPVNLNFQVLPGYDYGLRVVPTEAGDFRMVCNEFCGIGHHLMVGRVIVIDNAGGGK